MMPEERWPSAREMRRELQGLMSEGYGRLALARAKSGTIRMECPATVDKSLFESPEAVPQLSLRLVHSPDESTRRIVELERTPLVTIGRDSNQSTWPIGDDHISRLHATIQYNRATGSCHLVDRGSRNGVDVNGQRCGNALLEAGDVIRIGQSIIVVADESACASFGQSIVNVTNSSSHLLLTGEPGVGKERLAREIHRCSGRTGRFVTVDCASLNHEGALKELFGFDQRDATDSEPSTGGLFGAARNGTLFLNDISLLPTVIQTLLSRVLRRNSVRSIGDLEEHSVNTRVIATKSVPLDVAVSKYRLQLELYTWLAAIRIHIPPLRTRRHDIVDIAKSMAKGRGFNLCVDADVAEALTLGDWATNLSGLQRFITRISANPARSAPLKLVDLKRIEPELFSALQSKRNAPKRPSGQSPSATLREPTALERLLVESSGNVAKAAQVLGVSRARVYRWINKWGIDMESVRRAG